MVLSNISNKSGGYYRTKYYQGTLGTNNEISPTNIVTTENAKKPRYVPKYLSSQDLWDVVGDFNFNSAEGPNLLFYLKVKYQRKDIF